MPPVGSKSRKRASFNVRSPRVVGVVLAVIRNEHHVFRAAVLSIVLTLAIGPNAELLCAAWCHPQSHAAIECHHEHPTTFPGVAGDDNCEHLVVSVGAFLPEFRPEATSPVVDHAVAEPRYRLAPPTMEAQPAREPGRQGSLENRPLSTALRI